MTSLSEATLNHLRTVLDWPDLSGTKYEVVDKLGEGGMASVYLARDRDLDRHVALKVTHSADTDPEAGPRMAEEARILARLEHPSIVPIHDTGILPDGRLFFAMKLVRGQRLDEYARRTSALSERLMLFTKICEAVDFAHKHGFIHRDLKPGNIMVGEFGEVLVMDWGVAKRLAERKETTAATRTSPSTRPGDTAIGTVLGTPGFMSPEQARGALDEIDGRTDVYALGAILRVLLAFESVKGSGAGENSLPPALAAICNRSLAPDRADRYPTVRALAEDVMRYLAGLRVEAHPETLWQAAKRLAVKNRVALGLILAYIAMRVVLLAFTRS